jgi:hypothetical protein
MIAEIIFILCFSIIILMAPDSKLPGVRVVLQEALSSLTDGRRLHSIEHQGAKTEINLIHDQKNYFRYDIKK